MKQIVLTISILAFLGGFLSAQPCCERAVIDELYLPEDYFTSVFAAIDTPDTNPNPCDSCKLFFDLTDPVLHITDNNLDSLWAFLGRHFCTVDVESISYDDTSIYKEYDLVGIYSKESPLSAAKTTALINYVYNGGTLAILGDCCGLDNALNGLLSDSRWNLGLFINTDCILDSTNHFSLSPEFAIFKDLLEHSLMTSIDSLLLNKGASTDISFPANRLAWGDDDAYSVVYDPYPETTIVVASEPVVLSISRFGEGIVLLNSDMSIWTSVIWYPGSYTQFSNRQLAYNFFNCNIIPHFAFNHPKFSSIICFPEILYAEVNIENYGMIEPDSVRVKWESTVLTVASPFVSVSDSTLSLSLPLDSYFPGDTVNLCIEAICDTGGYWPFDSICWWYYLDPFVDSLGPTIERITTDSLYPDDTLLTYVYDTSGVDTASILVLMNLDTVGTFIFEAGTLAIWGFPDTTASVSVIIIVEDLYPCWDNVGSTSFSVDVRTKIAEINKPEDFEIRAYPNPFNSSVTVSISGECDSPLRIEIYDVQGRLIHVIARPKAAAISQNNRSSVSLDTRRDAVSINNGVFVWTPDESIGSGVYLVRVSMTERSVTKRLVYLK